MLETVTFGLLYLGGGLLALRGVLLLYRAIKERDFAGAFLMIGLFLFTATALFPFNETVKNYLYIAFGVCFLAFYIPTMFGDTILRGSLKNRLIFFFGILMLVLTLLFGSKIHLPDWVSYIPTF